MKLNGHVWIVQHRRRIEIHTSVFLCVQVCMWLYLIKAKQLFFPNAFREALSQKIKLFPYKALVSISFWWFSWIRNASWIQTCRFDCAFSRLWMFHAWDWSYCWKCVGVMLNAFSLRQLFFSDCVLICMHASYICLEARAVISNYVW